MALQTRLPKLPRLELPKVVRSRPGRLHCDLDNWDFDPRYTDGVCPICGWKPDYRADPLPAWEQALVGLPWDLVSLAILALVLVAIGIIVALSAHINLTPHK